MAAGLEFDYQVTRLDRVDLEARGRVLSYEIVLDEYDGVQGLHQARVFVVAFVFVSGPVQGGPLVRGELALLSIWGPAGSGGYY